MMLAPICIRASLPLPDCPDASFRSNDAIYGSSFVNVTQKVLQRDRQSNFLVGITSAITEQRRTTRFVTNASLEGAPQ